MIYTYQELLKQIESGIHLNFDDITKEQLERLFYDDGITNGQIALLYNVPNERVRTKRRKWDIHNYNPKYIYKRYENKNSSLFKILNEHAKENLQGVVNIDWISKALTHYLFRNGPVEKMHANHQLSENDMKTLNKYMVNRIAGLLKLVHDNEWLKIELMLHRLKNYGIEWDEVEFDTKDIDLIFKTEMDKEFMKMS